MAPVDLPLRSAALVVGLVALNGFFVAAEFALVKVRDTQLEPLVAGGHRGARVTRRVIRNLDASLSACQLGITLASLGLGWIGEPFFEALLRPALDGLGVASEGLRETAAVVVGFSVLTFLHISAGEQAPKWLAIQKALPVSLAVARPLRWFHLASWPFIWALNRVSVGLVRLVGIDASGEGEHPHSEDELRLVVAAAQERAGATALGRDIALNALDLRLRVARDVMRPRLEIDAFSTSDSIADCLEVAEKTRYSRFPICEGDDLDHTVGVVHIKDLYAMRQRASTAADLLPVARALVCVPPTARLEKVLELMLERRVHLALVVDEYGGTMGMVTLENILEELVGQIQDEFDQEKPRVVRVDDRTWEVDGSLPLHELSELVGEDLEDDAVATTGGWITQQLEGFPGPGDELERPGYRLRVESVEGMRVLRVRVERRAPEEPQRAEA